MSKSKMVLVVGGTVLVIMFAAVLASAGHDEPDRVVRAVATDDENVAAPPRPADGNVLEVAPAAPNYHLNWWTVSGGGVTRVAGSTYGLGLSAGQTVAGSVSGSSYNLAMGFWYGAVWRCPMQLFGDVDASGGISPADIIYIVNFIFKAGPDPVPCVAAADLDCSGAMSSADIIHLVNAIFKAGPPPCNTCLSALAGAC